METAMSACRNLAGRELNGRPLRIDSAMNAPGESFRAKGDFAHLETIELLYLFPCSYMQVP